MKRGIAFALVLVLVLSLVAAAFAAVPTAKMDPKYKNQTVKRGKTIKWKLDVDAKSYKPKTFGSKFPNFIRSYVQGYIKKGNSIIDSMWNYFEQNKYTMTTKWKVPKKAKKGVYTYQYQTMYFKTPTSKCRIGKTYQTNFTVK